MDAKVVKTGGVGTKIKILSWDFLEATVGTFAIQVRS